MFTECYVIKTFSLIRLRACLFAYHGEVNFTVGLLKGVRGEGNKVAVYGTLTFVGFDLLG